MFALRCTNKLLTRLKAKADPPSTTKLGDWSADVLNLGRERLVLCVSELTLLPVVPAIGAGVGGVVATKTQTPGQPCG